MAELTDGALAAISAGIAVLGTIVIIIAYYFCKRSKDGRTFSSQVKYVDLNYPHREKNDDINSNRMSSDIFPFEASMLKARNASLQSIPTSSPKNVKDLPYSESVTFFTKQSNVFGPVDAEVVEWTPRVVTGFGPVSMKYEGLPLTTFGKTDAGAPVWTSTKYRTHPPQRQSVVHGQTPVVISTIGNEPKVLRSSMKQTSRHSDNLGSSQNSAILVNQLDGGVHIPRPAPTKRDRFNALNSTNWSAL